MLGLTRFHMNIWERFSLSSLHLQSSLGFSRSSHIKFKMETWVQSSQNEVLSALSLFRPRNYMVHPRWKMTINKWQSFLFVFLFNTLLYLIYSQCELSLISLVAAFNALCKQMELFHMSYGILLMPISCLCEVMEIILFYTSWFGSWQGNGLNYI